MATDKYQILGIPKDASSGEIRAAYLRLARISHPDLNPGNAEAESRFKAIQLAYETLVDPKSRQLYDRGKRNNVVVYANDRRWSSPADVSWPEPDSYDPYFDVTRSFSGRRTLWQNCIIASLCLAFFGYAGYGVYRVFESSAASASVSLAEQQRSARYVRQTTDQPITIQPLDPIETESDSGASDSGEDVERFTIVPTQDDPPTGFASNQGSVSVGVKEGLASARKAISSAGGHIDATFEPATIQNAFLKAILEAAPNQRENLGDGGTWERPDSATGTWHTAPATYDQVSSDRILSQSALRSVTEPGLLSVPTDLKLDLDRVGAISGDATNGDMTKQMSIRINDIGSASIGSTNIDHRFGLPPLSPREVDPYDHTSEFGYSRMPAAAEDFPDASALLQMRRRREEILGPAIADGLIEPPTNYSPYLSPSMIRPSQSLSSLYHHSYESPNATHNERSPYWSVPQSSLPSQRYSPDPVTGNFMPGNFQTALPRSRAVTTGAGYTAPGYGAPDYRSHKLGTNYDAYSSPAGQLYNTGVNDPVAPGYGYGDSPY